MTPDRVKLSHTRLLNNPVGDSELPYAKIGKIYAGKPIEIKTRGELLASLRPNYWRFLRHDNGDVPIEEPLRATA